MIVVDASLATKWFLNERDSDRARAFLAARGGQLRGPDVLAIEVSRALVAAANARRMDQRNARVAIALWLESVAGGALTLHPSNPRMIQTAVDIAFVLGHPLADCLYLALSLQLGCELATCDVKFRDKAVGSYPQVRLLSDLR